VSSVLRISEASTIGFHALVLFAANGKRHYSTREIAESLSVSEWHLSKILQRLTRSGIIRSVRGPGGGYTLAGKGTDVTLLEVLEAIDGPFEPDDCLMRSNNCVNRECIMGELLASMNKKVKSYLTNKKLSDFKDAVYMKKRTRKR